MDEAPWAIADASVGVGFEVERSSFLLAFYYFGRIYPTFSGILYYFERAYAVSWVKDTRIELGVSG
eukprot:snap_masked-scaffold_5-processed-gene-7.23-mRNA-1 protein AED:1.00 eAED:1.00 QI:0/0/0/0/1/1/2/0/65